MSARDDAPLSFDARIGGVLVAPRRTLARLAAGEARPGDVTALLVLRVVVGQLPDLVRAALLVRDEGLAVGLMRALSVFTAVLPDLVAILAGGMMLSLVVQKGARGYGRAFDLAAYAWIPYLAVVTLRALVYTVRQYPPSPGVEEVTTALGVGWGVVVWTVAALAARAPAAPPSTTAPPPSSPSEAGV